MRRMRRISKAVLGGLLCLGCLACGGGGSKLVNLSGTSVLSSADALLFERFRYEAVVFTATRNGQVIATMNTVDSNSVRDPFIIVERNGVFIADDDDSGDGLSARVVFAAVQGTTYTVYFTTYRTGDAGAYNWSIREM